MLSFNVEKKNFMKTNLNTEYEYHFESITGERRWKKMKYIVARR